MTRNDLQELANKHGMQIDPAMPITDGWRVAFELGRMEEREACLDLCYTIGGEFKEEWAEHNEDKYRERCLGAGECADAIRARGQA